ncbi:MAG: hypothetical protein ACYC8V_13905 [Caulobacteraceae bacterium]
MGNGTTSAETAASSGYFPERTREEVEGKLKRALYRAQDVYGRAADRAKDAGRRADRLISDQTYPALAVVAAVGVGVGLLLGFAIAGRD